MFAECKNIKNINFIHFNTKKVINMEKMFYGCNNLETINLFSFDTKNVTNTNNMFDNCNNLKNLDLSSFNFKNIDYKNDLSSIVLKGRNLYDIMYIKLHIIYKIDKNKDSIQLFGKDFVSNNEDKCFLLINKEKYKLCQELKLKENQKNKSILEIILISLRPITYITKMFYYCNSLKSLYDFEKWDTQNVTDMSYIFFNCSSLEYLPDISTWNTKNVKSLIGIFSGCSSLKSLPDISKWDTQNVIDLSYNGSFYNYSIFSNCTSLESLPDISKWNIKRLLI